MNPWNLDFDLLMIEVGELTDEELSLAKKISDVLNQSKLSAYEKNRALCVTDKVLYHKALGKLQTELL